jgi:hydroxyacylglutathione hydrolase
VKDRPVSYVLGGHIEMNARGELFPWESQVHPDEHALQMSKTDLLALPTAIGSFNGFYSTDGKFVMMNSMRMLIAFGVIAVVILIACVWIVVHYVRRRIRTRRRAHQ